MATKNLSSSGGITPDQLYAASIEFAGLFNGTFQKLFGSVDEIPEVMEIFFKDFGHCQEALLDGLASESEPVQIHQTLKELIGRRYEDYKQPIQRIRNARMYMLLSYAYAAKLSDSIEEKNWPMALKVFGLRQLYFGMAFGTFGISRNSLESNVRRGAAVMLANDPRQKDKANVKECWEEWIKNPLDRNGKKKYTGKAAFAKDMLTKFESLKSAAVISRWCLSWEKEKITRLA